LGKQTCSTNKHGAKLIASGDQPLASCIHHSLSDK